MFVSARCVHTRFLQECIEPVYRDIWSSNREVGPTPLVVKILQSIKEVNSGVVRLGHHREHLRFSIISPDHKSAAIVATQNRHVRCLHGECRARKGHTRKITTIKDPGSCPHLQLLCAFPNIWPDTPSIEVEPSSEEDLSTSEVKESVDESPDTDQPHSSEAQQPPLEPMQNQVCNCLVIRMQISFEILMKFK